MNCIECKRLWDETERLQKERNIPREALSLALPLLDASSGKPWVNAKVKAKQALGDK